MHDLELGVRDPRPTGRTAIGRLRLVADAAAVADERLDTLLGQPRREVRGAVLDR